jgi:3-oxoacyl-[acyl-carrier-protein] synthase II
VNRRRVAVTGIGMVTPLGCSLDATLEALGRGERAAGPATLFDASVFGEPEAAEVRQLDARSHFRAPKAMKLTDRAARFAIAAASMALADARWTPQADEHENLGVVIGVSGSDLQAGDLARAIGPDPESRCVHDIRCFAERISSRLNPLWLLVNLPNMSSAHVAIQLEARGPNSTIMSDWIAGNQAIGEAFDWIGSGESDAVLAGGADSAVYPFVYGSYQQGGLLGRRASQGGMCASAEPRFVPAEGAAILMLEEWERARRRGARIRGEILAYATAASLSPPDPTAAVPATAAPRPAANALARTLQTLLDTTGWRPDEIRALVTASVFDERFRTMEEAALRTVFGAPLDRVPRWECTSALGHALAASGPIDLAIALSSPALPGRGDGLLCSALGYSGQAASLAVRAESWPAAA